MPLPVKLQEYRQILLLKKGIPESVFEVLAPEVLCTSSKNIRYVNWGVCNNNNHHWALATGCCTFAFVWETERNKNESDSLVVTGARCLRECESIEDLMSCNWIGATRLDANAIEEAGSPPSRAWLNVKQISFADMLDVIMFCGITGVLLSVHYYTLFLIIHIIEIRWNTSKMTRFGSILSNLIFAGSLLLESQIFQF